MPRHERLSSVPIPAPPPYERNKQGDVVWTDALNDWLRAAWATGAYTADIGRKARMSKSTIVGRAHRINIDARPSPILAAKPKQPAIPPAPKQTLSPLSALSAVVETRVTTEAKTMPLVMAAQIATEAAARVAPAVPPPVAVEARPVFEWRSSAACCWPIGDPGTRTFRFCDDRAVPGKPYCDEHCSIAYVRRSGQEAA